MRGPPFGLHLLATIQDIKSHPIGKAIGYSRNNEERGIIRVLSGLNEPVDELRFALEGMEIPAGTPIAPMGGLRTVGLTKWDGDAIVPLPTPDQEVRGSRWKSGWLVAASISAIGAAATFWSIGRGRQRPAP